MPDSRATAALENVEEADNVGVGVRRGVFDRVTHAGLRRQMHDRVELRRREKVGHWFSFYDIEFLKDEPLARPQAIKPCQLQPDIVVIVQIVYAYDFVAA